MHLYIKCENEEIQEYYKSHSSYHEGDAGLDIFCPEDITIPKKSMGKVNLGISCEAVNKSQNFKKFCYFTYLGLLVCLITYFILEVSLYSKADEVGLSLLLIYTLFILVIDILIYNTRLYQNLGKEMGCSYYMYPRSSIIKTPLRIANSVGIIDRGYRGNLMACFDNISDEDYTIVKGTRLIQICSPYLDSISFSLKDNLSETSRGSGGYGSTGV